ncbi:peptidoglycan-binding domain-containing protein [Streptomyces cucumeris]|uniref:peptidoglycan-binding domain-containing protein n=1 Tax=Streptomyces cucumeris TaxID=2962890 RepID=UPI003D75EE37
MPTTGTATESSGPGRRPTPTSGPTQESQAAYCRAPSSCRAHARSLRRGDVGPDVHRLQQFLFGQGFTYVSASGVFDEATVRGVAQYQRNRGITGDPSGVFGPATSASAQAAARQKNTWR